jgi:hypothetical protein
MVGSKTETGLVEEGDLILRKGDDDGYLVGVFEVAGGNGVESLLNALGELEEGVEGEREGFEFVEDVKET